MKWNLLFLVLLSVMLGSLTSGCGTEELLQNSAEQVVEEMYRALSEGDADAYMDTILPENRRRPNPFGMLGG